MEIRSEAPGDFERIRVVETEAFPTRAEADLVDRLRADGSAVFSLVALLDGAVVGHVMFSRMQLPEGALGLGPVAVLAKHRRQGIAAALIREGLSRAKAQDWGRVFVLGDPAYYTRFGFDPSLAQGFASSFAGPHLMGLALRPGALVQRSGPLDYAKAFAELA